MDPADLERMMGVNLYGTVHAMQAVLPSMRARSRGNIVNIASLAGRRGLPPLGGYCATKFAVVGLTEALRVELYGTAHGPGEQQQEGRAARQHYCVENETELK
jgi:NADP-dependent 3-hydroxy acid dehydrogenase YdfG